MDRERQGAALWSGPDELEQALLARVAQGQLRVPPYPTVALKLRNLVNQKDYGLDAVLSLVSTDAALVADVLRVANAAFFGRGTVSSLQQAVNRVGATQVTRLAMVSGLSGIARAPGSLAPLRRQAWQASVSSAAICQTLAPLRKLAGESAFVAGLLHDFGWLVGIAAIEELLAQSPAAPAREEIFWSEAIARCHTRLGLELASRWNLPDLLRDAIGLHHGNFASSTYAPFVELVALSDLVLALLQSRPRVEPDTLAQVPGLTAREREALAEAIPQFPELISAFDAEPQGAPAPTKLLTSAPALPDGFSARDFAVHQLSPRKRGPFHALGSAETMLLMKGREALPEKQLVELELEAQPRLRFWAKVERCAAEPGGYRLECRPFALTGATLEQWKALAAG